MNNFEETMEKLKLLTIRQSALQQQYADLVNLHGSAVQLKDMKREAELRAQIHETVDMLLDVTVEVTGLNG